MSKKRMLRPLLGQIFKSLAPKIGARVLMEPEWQIVGQVTFKNRRRRYFRYSSLDLNPLGASEIAKDKDYAAFFMRRMGYPAIRGKTFFVDWWCEMIGSRRDIHAAYRYAAKLGFPVFVKPNSGSQGVGVAKVYTKQEVYQAMRFIFARDRVALIQKPVQGRDYRIVVLDTSIISAYERVPLRVEGDGVSTIRQLLAQKQKQFTESGRDKRIKLNDPRIGHNLHRQKLSMRSRPGRGRVISLLDNANLSSGGEAIDVTAKIHPAFRRIAIQLTKDMGLRFCGLDLIVEGEIAKSPQRYWVLEVNAAPGLDHYAKVGKAQQKIVERLYLRVLKAME